MRRLKKREFKTMTLDAFGNRMSRHRLRRDSGAARRFLQSNEPASLNRRPFDIRGPVPITRRCARKAVQTRPKPRLNDLRGYRFWELGLLRALANSRLRREPTGYPIAIRPDTHGRDSRAANEGSFVTGGESPRRQFSRITDKGIRPIEPSRKGQSRPSTRGAFHCARQRDFIAMPVKAIQ